MPAAAVPGHADEPAQLPAISQQVLLEEHRHWKGKFPLTCSEPLNFGKPLKLAGLAHNSSFQNVISLLVRRYYAGLFGVSATSLPLAVSAHCSGCW